MMKLLILLTWMILMTKKMTRMILMTKMMTWRKYDTALSSAAAAGAELNGHLLTRAFLPVIVTVVMMMLVMRWVPILIKWMMLIMANRSQTLTMRNYNRAVSSHT